MKVMVTGGTGFVGGHLVDALLRAGDDVTALVRSPGKASGLAERGVRIAVGDLDDSAALRAATEGQDVIYHVGGLIRARSAAEFLAVNRDGTARLVEAASAVSRARIVLVSSLAAGGPVARGSRRTGDEPAHPVTDYGRSKLAGEAVVRSGTLPWTIARPPIVYGPRDGEFLRAFKMVRLGIVPVFGDGTQELSLVYAPDLAEGLAAIGRCQQTAGRVLYPCHGEVLSTAGLVKTIARVMQRRIRVVRLPRPAAELGLGLTSLAAGLRGRATLLTRDKAHEFFAPAWTADPGPLEAATGWRAGHGLADGLEATAAWYRAAGWL